MVGQVNYYLNIELVWTQTPSLSYFMYHIFSSTYYLDIMPHHVDPWINNNISRVYSNSSTTADQRPTRGCCYIFSPVPPAYVERTPH